MLNLHLGSAQQENDHGDTSTATTKQQTIAEPLLVESSGLAASSREPGYFWSHNDSGDSARMFAFNDRGQTSGRCQLVAASAIDCEDMASFLFGGRSHLLLADCGDNQRRRSSISLHLVEEPDPTKTTMIHRVGTIVVSYPDGPADCEAVAVDVDRGQILLITKNSLPIARVYAVNLDCLNDPLPWTKHASATYMGAFAMPMVTAADINPRNGDLWVANYFKGFCFRCRDRNASLAAQLNSLPEPAELPPWRQIEAIGVDAKGDVWVTSEGSPASFGRILIPPPTPLRK
ncbi:hypothetical protein [Novipirellula artificiosorum]|uniref:hypothetical protein n=1 Tax=Novipirellula artificiosorum TaxID=2528016 RepID=UPI0018CFDF33|nr:hypothetical protein [Novipirellula artificiosorum]